MTAKKDNTEAKKNKRVPPPPRVRKMTKEVFEAVCFEIETSHKGLNTLCKERNSSASAFYDWVDNNEEATDRYARAKSRQADHMADLIVEVAFDDEDDEKDFVGINHIHRDKLKIDSLKFIAAKLKPKKYGEKIDITSDDKPIGQVVVFQLPDNNRD